MGKKLDNADGARRALIGRLESLQRSGVLQLPKAAAVAVTADAQASPPQEATTNSTTAALLPPVGERPLSEKQKPGWRKPSAQSLFDAGESAARDDGSEGSALSLEVLQQHVAGCTRCDELARTRTQTVFGVGNPAARLCFLGEAPGADEDRLGEPFVGRAGQLLTKIIEACRMKREDVYILNMIKCRPPGNRNPLPTELSNCRGYLERQLDFIRPEFICCLGAVAAQNLLGTTLGIGKLRGKVHAFRGAKVVCTYHPAFLLRSPSFKKETWEDMKLLLREMGVELA
jgi:DNA polymerase